MGEVRRASGHTIVCVRARQHTDEPPASCQACRDPASRMSLCLGVAPPTRVRCVALAAAVRVRARAQLCDEAHHTTGILARPTSHATFTLMCVSRTGCGAGHGQYPGVDSYVDVIHSGYIEQSPMYMLYCN